MDMLLCKACQIEKPLTDFYPPRSRSRGKYPWRQPPEPQQPCKSCWVTRTTRDTNLRKTKDPERVRAQDNARLARWRARNPEKLKKAADKRRHAPRERERVYAKEYNQRPQVKKANIVHSGRRRARKRELPNTFTQADYDFMMQYWHYSCAVCGKENGFEWTIAMDHWIPFKHPTCPGTIATNIIPLCHGVTGCNNSKSNKEPITWLVERYGQRKAKHIASAIIAFFAHVQEHQSVPEVA